jgi:putative phosphoribosyl transferase
MIFKNREEAGQKLAEALKEYKNRKDAIVLGLARGGVVIAAEIGNRLGIFFDLIMTRKIGAPMNPELAIGAITETGKGYFNEKLIRALRISSNYIDQTVKEEKEKALKHLTIYRHKAPSIRGKSVIIADDGIATGATMMAAVLSVQEEKPKEIIIAVPVASSESLNFLDPFVDKIICLFAPYEFMSVSQFYESFPQTQDTEIIDLLKRRNAAL